MADPRSADSSAKPTLEASNPSSAPSIEKDFVLNADGTVLRDHKGAPVTVNKFLATKPLRAAVSQRVGPGGKKLAYMGGEVVTQTLNEAFGYDGWCMEVKNTMREETAKDDKGRYVVAYNATVRITHRRSGVFREDCGSGDSIDRSLGTASGHAIKSAITDALKRAARHFGEKLGNALYHDGFSLNNAPVTLKDAFESLDVQRAKSRFGFDKDKAHAAIQNSHSSQQQSTASHYQQANANAPIKQETRPVPNASTTYTANTYTAQCATTQMNATPAATSNSLYAAQNTQYAKNNDQLASQPKAYVTAAPLTPHHGANSMGAAARKSIDAADFSAFNATPSRMNNAVTSVPNTGRVPGTVSLENAVGKENSNPQQSVAGGGLNLPPRPGTSRGMTSNTNTDSMLGLASSLLSMSGQSDSSALKRNSESLDGSTGGPPAKIANTGVKNPYNTWVD